MKILFYATWPTQTNGYARVANVLSNWIADRKEVTEFYYFGISHFKESSIATNRFIHPKITLIDVLEEEKKIGSSEIYGTDIIEEWMFKIKPDVFFVYNDLIVTCRLFNALLNYRSIYHSKTRVVTYIDLVYPFEKLELIRHMDRNSDKIVVFSKVWKENLLQMGVDNNKISILHHGIDEVVIDFDDDEEFFNDDEKCEISKQLSRFKLGLDKDDFIILNTNRNSYRKANDLTISSFICFLKSKNFDNRIKLFLNCALDSPHGYDILNVIKTECVRENISFENQVQSHILIDPKSPGYISDEKISLLYSACDLGVNTCVGEGFGLCNVEHAAYGRPQIVSKVGAFVDIFGDVSFSKAVEPIYTIYASNQLDGHGGDISFCRKEDFAEAFSFYFENPSKSKEDGELVRKYVKTKFSWKKILEEELEPLFISFFKHV